MRLAVSGVSRGIGESLSRQALARGDSVHGLGRTLPPWADDMKEFVFSNCDMAEPGQLVKACSQISGAIDVLVCNAATFAEGAGTIEYFHPDAMSEAFSVNTMAPLIIARSLKDNLSKGQRRLIIMMSTGNASLQGNTTGSLLGYRLSKTALNQAVRTLAAEWGPQGFIVVALNPGWVRTDMGGPDAEISADQAAAQILDFIDGVSLSNSINGAFVNTDGSPLPW
jgi:NAD(P)-dependent dehydrogenase (short-subunit alcohol dehydrogenase family)